MGDGCSGIIILESNIYGETSTKVFFVAFTSTLVYSVLWNQSVEYSTILITKIGFGRNTLNFSKYKRRERSRETNKPLSYIEIPQTEKSLLSDWDCWRIVSDQGAEISQWGDPLQNFSGHLEIADLFPF